MGLSSRAGIVGEQVGSTVVLGAEEVGRAATACVAVAGMAVGGARVQHAVGKCVGRSRGARGVAPVFLGRRSVAVVATRLGGLEAVLDVGLWELRSPVTGLVEVVRSIVELSVWVELHLKRCDQGSLAAMETRFRPPRKWRPDSARRENAVFRAQHVLNSITSRVSTRSSSSILLPVILTLLTCDVGRMCHISRGICPGLCGSSRFAGRGAGRREDT